MEISPRRISLTLDDFFSGRKKASVSRERMNNSTSLFEISGRFDPQFAGVSLNVKINIHKMGEYALLRVDNHEVKFNGKYLEESLQSYQSGSTSADQNGYLDREIRALKWIDEASTKKELKEANLLALQEIKKTPIDPNKEVLKVDLTGEIFMVLDSFSNQNLERELGKLGVETKRSMSLGGWLKTAIIPKFMRKEETHIERAFKFAKPYLLRDIGGDAIESVSDVAYATSRGIDGIIHISPFTCMPEIMSQNIFPRMRQDGAIPILPLVLDEQTGTAGFVTRLEAFVDLMRRKKMQVAAGMAY